MSSLNIPELVIQRMYYRIPDEMFNYDLPLGLSPPHKLSLSEYVTRRAVANAE